MRFVTDRSSEGFPAGFSGVVLAAGRGSRMGGDVPKVLLPVAGRPVVERVCSLLLAAGVSPLCVVVSPQTLDPVRTLMGPDVLLAVQPEPRGSGDAVRCAASVLRDVPGDVLVACGDSPLFTVQSVRGLMRAHREGGAAVTLVTALLDDPSGYGRIVRAKPGGPVARIVEERCADSAVRAVREVNGGLYAFRAEFLWPALEEAASLERPGEFVLTELVELAARRGLGVAAVVCPAEEVAGVNTPGELRRAEEVLLAREAESAGGC
jgi:bifunctional UDP-N-acetylglucosamine pyrophosphorylase/glucosamine-1-phosphate N-acetyltransferase